MGRPIGVPGDPAFQIRVVTAALELLEAPSGPVLMDYLEDAPPVEGPAALVCPISFSIPESEESDAAKLTAKLLEEIALMRPWYDRAVDNSKRTTVGVSGMAPESLGSFVAEFLEGGMPEPKGDLSPPALFKLAIEDLKAYYFEAATAQPGQQDADSNTLSGWFYQETVAGSVLFAVGDAHRDTEDKNMRLVINTLLIPRAQRRDSPSEAKR